MNQVKAKKLEVKSRRRPNQGTTKQQAKDTSSPLESQNKFEVLQEEENEKEDENHDEAVNETTPMEIIKDGKRKIMSISKETEGETEVRQEIMGEQSVAESNPMKEMSTEEEKVMKKLLSEWRNLDERFIPEKEKQLFKETFQKYKEKKGGSADPGGNQESQGNGNGKSGRKKGRRTLIESIQTVGETLVNSGRVIPLSEVFQQTTKSFK